MYSTISCRHLLYQFLYLNSVPESEKTGDFKNSSFMKNGINILSVFKSLKTKLWFMKSLFYYETTTIHIA